MSDVEQGKEACKILSMSLYRKRKNKINETEDFTIKLVENQEREKLIKYLETRETMILAIQSFVESISRFNKAFKDFLGVIEVNESDE